MLGWRKSFSIPLSGERSRCAGRNRRGSTGGPSIPGGPQHLAAQYTRGSSVRIDMYRSEQAHEWAGGRSGGQPSYRPLARLPRAGNQAASRRSGTGCSPFFASQQADKGLILWFPSNTAAQALCQLPRAVLDSCYVSCGSDVAKRPALMQVSKWTT